MKTVLALVLAALPLAADTVILRDRSVVEGKVKRSAKALAVGGKSHSLRDVLLWEDAGGLVKYEASFRARMKAYRILSNRSVVAAAVPLVEKAIAAGARDAARTLLERAERAGLDPKRAASFGASIC